MKRQYRTLIVMVVAVGTAALASFAVYRAVQSMPVREVEVASMQVVVAAEALPVGTRLDEKHLKVVDLAVPESRDRIVLGNGPLVDRGVITAIGENEPVTATKVASPEEGAGLPPIIPAGMRAISVRVNDVIGVAGFAVPGTRVDVVVTVDNGQGEPMSRTVVSHVQVLTAGTKFDQEKSKDGKPIPTSVVTLMVLPEDARADCPGLERRQDHARAAQPTRCGTDRHEGHPSRRLDARHRARTGHRSDASSRRRHQADPRRRRLPSTPSKRSALPNGVPRLSMSSNNRRSPYRRGLRRSHRPAAVGGGTGRPAADDDAQVKVTAGRSTIITRRSMSRASR